MSSVTTEAATNLSFPAVPARPARSDPSSGSDSFSALVDSNTPVDTGSDRAAAAADAQSAAPQRRSDAAAADARQARNDSATERVDEKARRKSDERDAADGVPDGGAGTEATAKPRDKPTDAKADATKSAEKPVSNDASATLSAADPEAAAQSQANPAAITTTPVAVAIAVPVVATEIAPASPISGLATAPLAIAAAGIAASAAVTDDKPPAITAPVQIDPAATASATVAGETAVTNTKAAVPAAAGKTIGSEKLPAIATDAAEATDTALAASVAGVVPAEAKATLSKGSVPASTGASTAKTASGDGERTQKASDPSATATAIAPGATAQRPATVGPPKSGYDVAGAARAEASSTPAISLTAREHSAPPDTKLAPTDPAVQPASTFQPLLQTAAAPTSSAALTATAATSAAVPLSGLALEIAASAKGGKTSFEIRLDPADLGRIDVRIDVDRHGQVTSHLTVEKPETLSMLRQDAPQLQRALDNAGFKTGDGGLQFSLRDQSSSGQDDGSRQGRHSQRLIVHDEDAIPATIAGQTYGRMLGSSSGVDIRI